MRKYFLGNVVEAIEIREITWAKLRGVYRSEVVMNVFRLLKLMTAAKKFKNEENKMLNL